MRVKPAKGKYSGMKTYSCFLKEDHDFLAKTAALPPGAIIQVVQGDGMFAQKRFFVMKTSHGLFKIKDFREVNGHFVGMVGDPYQPENVQSAHHVLEGLKKGDKIHTYLQLDALPDGAVIRAESVHDGVPERQFRKVGENWMDIDTHHDKVPYFHFDDMVRDAVVRWVK